MHWADERLTDQELRERLEAARVEGDSVDDETAGDSERTVARALTELVELRRSMLATDTAAERRKVALLAPLAATPDAIDALVELRGTIDALVGSFERSNATILERATYARRVLAKAALADVYLLISTLGACRP